MRIGSGAGAGPGIVPDRAGIAVQRPLWLALAGCLGLAGWLAWSRGGWLDEYWTLWYSDPAIPFGKAFRTRWVADTQHPPTFYGLAWVFGHLTGPSLGGRRLAGDALGLLAVTPPLWLSRRRGRVPLAVLLGLLLVFSGPYAVSYLAEHRSYALGLCAATGLVVALRHAHLTGLGDGRLRAPAVCVLFSAMVAGCLHYTLSLILLILLGCFGLFHLVAGRRVLGAVAAGAIGLTLVPLLVSLALGLSRQAPVIAIHVGLWAGWRTIVAMAVLGFAVGPVAIAMAWPAVRRLARDPRARADPHMTFAMVLLATLGLSVVAFALLEVLTRNMYPRLLLGLLPLGAFATAELASRAVWTGRIALAAGANALVVAAAAFAIQRADPRMDLFGPDLAAAADRRCVRPTLVAVDPVALDPPPPGGRVVGQREAIATSYRAVAARWGVPVHLWPQDGPVPPPERGCARLVWLDHGFLAPPMDAATLLARIGASVPPGARVSDRRWRSHYLVRIDPR